MSNPVYDSGNGVRTILHEEDNAVIAEYVQRVDTIMDDFREESETINRNAHGRIAARVPISTHFEWVREWENTYKSAGAITLDQFLVMKINSADFKHLRNQRL